MTYTALGMRFASRAAAIRTLTDDLLSLGGRDPAQASKEERVYARMLAHIALANDEHRQKKSPPAPGRRSPVRPALASPARGRSRHQRAQRALLAHGRTQHPPRRVA